jgi:hypothetical protein
MEQLNLLYRKMILEADVVSNNPFFNLFFIIYFHFYFKIIGAPFNVQ